MVHGLLCGTFGPGTRVRGKSSGKKGFSQTQVEEPCFHLECSYDEHRFLLNQVLTQGKLRQYQVQTVHFFLFISIT